MKPRISISISRELVENINKISKNYNNRSDFIETAIILYLKKSTIPNKYNNDLEIINKNSKQLNSEAIDVLSYLATSALIT